MNELADFLRARLDEDEQAARAAFSGQVDPEDGWGAERAEGYRHTTITPHVGMIHEPVQADHVVRWNPARVLREVAAKRALMVELDSSGGPETEDAYHVVLRRLAAVYADHPDYREEWRP